MDKLIESMSNINVRKNDGYLFIKRDEIYVPIMKTILLITKRSFYSLPLLDEIVLRLINEGIQEIDELVNILGIDRISGYGNRLTIEKIHIEGCPQCGGKMKYYNKPVEWREILRSDGSTKREVTKRIPVLECKRNAEHWYAVDPAEDRVK